MTWKPHGVVHATTGKGKQTLHGIQRYLQPKGVNKRQIQYLNMDLSPAFIAGAREAFPKANIHLDRYHVVKLLNTAMDDVRKLERKEHQGL